MNLKKEYKIGVLKYKSCNVRSLVNALDAIGVKYFVSSNFNEISNLDKIILPGVGNMKNLKESGAINQYKSSIQKYIQNGGMLLGICLGLQILFEFSEEADCETLSIFKGTTKKIKDHYGINLNVGFHKLALDNDILNNNSIKKLFYGINNQAKFYFLHSFYCDEHDNQILKINTKINNKKLACLFSKGNILGTQFHPELSRKEGLIFLKNFCNHF